MKKLIVIAVVFALVAGAAFAVDLGGTVFGHVNVMKGSTEEDSKVLAGGGMDRVRIDGSGEAGEGKFGGYIRLDKGDDTSALAWWKPIDQFKLTIGKNGDGIWAKEGVTGWGFNQMPNDSGIAINPGIWFGSWDDSVYSGGFKPLNSRYTFFEGYTDNSAALEIKPLDMLGINIAIPFIAMDDGELEDVLKATIAQLDLNFDFGNIALTYVGKGTSDNNRSVTNFGDAGAIFLYFGGSFGDLGLDIAFAYHMADDADVAVPPLGFGLGLKYASDAFGIKFKATAALGGDKGYKDLTFVNISVLPYFAINDNISAFLNAGLGMASGKDDTFTGFFINPYLRVGAEWGPTFYFGIQLSSDLSKDGKFLDGSDSVLKFNVPISLMVSF